MLSRTDRSTPPPAATERRPGRPSTPPPPDASTRLDAAAPSGPATPSHGRPAGPPPPPTAPRLPADDGTSRATAATWVAATGALLLLVATGTFLAVSWDVLGMTARVAVVASITAAAIVGGHRLRPLLPAVGAVLFHLGALLLPVDALGLALQLDLSVAAAWMLTGAVTVLALPPLAVAGRSRVLAGAAVVGVPVFATGLGLEGTADPALVVAAVGFVALATTALPGTRVAQVWRAAPVALAATSVLLPLIAVVLDVSLAQGQIVAAIRSAGWAPSSWALPTVVGVLAVATVAARAELTRSRRLAALTPVIAAVGAVVALLPESTPRLAWLLAGPLLLLVAEVVAMIADEDRTWGPLTHGIAVVLEVVAALTAVAVVQLVVAPQASVGSGTDGELAVALTVATVALVAGALRRWSWGGPLDGVGVTLAGGVVLFAAAAVTVALPAARTPVTAAVLLTSVAAGVLLTGAFRVDAEGIARWSEGAAAVVAATLAVLACGAAWDTVVALPVAVIAAPLVGLYLRSLLAHDHRWARPVTAVVAPVAALSSTLLAGDGGLVPNVAAGHLQALVLQIAIAGVATLGLAATIDRLPWAADGVRGLAVVILVVALDSSYVTGTARVEVVTGAQWNALQFLRPIPALLVVLGPAAVWLVLDAWRTRRTAVAVLAAPVVVRLLASVIVGFGVGPVVLGAVLLGAGLLALTVALTARPRQVRAALGVVAAIAAVPGWFLIGATEEAQAIALIALGAVGVVIGIVRRSQLIGHGGGILAILGIWLLLDLRGVTATDLWMLPVAVQLAAAGTRARRLRTVSSWVIDVPPLLIVAIPAIAERLTGGPGYHTLLAGAVAMLAVIHGGAAGRGGPLTSGSVVLVTVVVVETVAYAALVPTWAWFAVAGTVLLGAAVLIERRGLSPGQAVDTLRHLAADSPSAPDEQPSASPPEPPRHRGGG